MRALLPFCLLVLFLLAGCGAPARKEARPVATEEKAGLEIRKQEGAPNPNEAAKEAGFVALQDAAAPQAGKNPPEKKAQEQTRKIRYTADMKLVVEKIDDAEEALDAAKKEAKGEYSKVEINNSSGVVRSGTWRIRVPVDNLHSFRKAVAKIGEVERNTLESDDITAQYYDLDAHITNRKVEQEATREFLKEIGKKDTRYLEVKRELDAISDDINRKEGQLKLWKDLTDLTTFTVHMREKQPYVPEAKVADKEIPTFGTRASSTWNASWENFLGFCQAIAIVAIAITPWLPIPLILAFFVWLTVRRMRPAPPVSVAVVEPISATKG